MANYIDFTALVARVSNFLGYGVQVYTSLTADQLAHVYQCIDDGYNAFLTAHTWSFLHKSASISTTADDGEDDLPSDFASLRDKKNGFRFAADTGYNPVVVTSQGHIEELRSASDYSGVPTHCAIRYKSGFTGAALVTYEVMWYPKPDAVYAVSYHYNVILPTEIRTATPYPIGTQIHGRTILEFCLAAAERILDDTQQVHAMEAQKLLMQSIQRDAENAPATLGYNRDQSLDDRITYDPVYYVSVDGTVYD